jgi:hypothetical protein
VWHCNRRNLQSCFSEGKLRRCSCSAFSVCGRGCAYLSLQMKAIKPHLVLLVSSSHRLFIIRSSHCYMQSAWQPLVILECWLLLLHSCTSIG